jgi:cyclopropane fatty-acyl-phospholipid synthase-like methyltransferase
VTDSALNSYARQLTDAQIRSGEHRNFVGGMWEAIGRLQFDFLKGRGLEPQDRLLDVGCGACRGGLHFVDYLDAGRYFGIDINQSLLTAGQKELTDAGLMDKAPQLLLDEAFRFERFGERFDWAIAISVFTHLPTNHIVRCLVEMKKVLAQGGRFYASFFQAPTPAHLETIRHHPGGIISHFDSDPYHYGFAEVCYMAAVAELDVELIGDWGHPRDQQMLCFFDGAASAP